MDQGHIGQWSKRRRSIIEQVHEEQSRSVRLGHTEEYEDRLTVAQWHGLLSSKVGVLGLNVAIGTTNNLGSVPFARQHAIEIAALALSMAESLDRQEEVRNGTSADEGSAATG